MSEPREELLQELLRRLHGRDDKAEAAISDLRTECISLRRLVAARQDDMANLYQLLHRAETRLDRIEKRLDLREFSEAAQSVFEPDT
jgi:chromosome segregation ATPase